jgi:hypothetical protein
MVIGGLAEPGELTACRTEAAAPLNAAWVGSALELK